MAFYLEITGYEDEGEMADFLRNNWNNPHGSITDPQRPERDADIEMICKQVNSQRTVPHRIYSHDSRHLDIEAATLALRGIKFRRRIT